MTMTTCELCNGTGTIGIRSSNGHYFAPGPVPDDAKGVKEAKCWDCNGTGEQAVFTSVSDCSETENDVILKAREYMAAVASLGSASGYNGMTYFEVPLLSSPEEIGTEAIARWKHLDATGKALKEALDKASLSHPRKV